MTTEWFERPPRENAAPATPKTPAKLEYPTPDDTPTERRTQQDCDRAIGRFSEHMRYYAHADRQYILAHLAILFHAAAAANAAPVPLLSAMVKSFPHELLTPRHVKPPLDPDQIPESSFR